MKLAHFERDGAIRVGLVHGGRIFDLEDAAKKLGLQIHSKPLTIDSLLSDGTLGSLQQAERNLTGAIAGVSLETIRLLSPVLNPEKILLLAVNYASHKTEQNAKRPTEPYLFTRFRNSLIGPGDPILVPRVSKKADWEAELAVVIGRGGKYIAKEDAMRHVAGYTIANDISFRDLQYSTRSPDGKTTLGLNWVKGKGLDASFPLGPWLVTRDEIPEPHNLDLSLALNGVKKQQSNTSDMIFHVDSLIEYASAGVSLNPGDILSTGTPGGVAAHTGEPFLKDGDILEASIERIGTLRNPVKAESPEKT